MTDSSNSPVFPPSSDDDFEHKVRFLVKCSPFRDSPNFEDFVTRLLTNAEASVHIRDVNGQGGSGFMISQNLFMTNWHVLPSRSALKGAVVDFYYCQAGDRRTRTAAVDCDGLYISNKALDYAVVTVDVSALQHEIVYLTPECPDLRSEAEAEKSVITLSFPNNDPLCISLHGKRVAGSADLSRMLITNELHPGSSGGMIFDSISEKIIGIVHAEPTDDSNFNYAINIKAIWSDLKLQMPTNHSLYPILVKVVTDIEQQTVRIKSRYPYAFKNVTAAVQLKEYRNVTIARNVDQVLLSLILFSTFLLPHWVRVSAKQWYCPGHDEFIFDHGNITMELNTANNTRNVCLNSVPGAAETEQVELLVEVQTERLTHREEGNYMRNPTQYALDDFAVKKLKERIKHHIEMVQRLW